MKTSLLATTALFLLAGHAVASTTISLNFDTLPSAQGWQFVGDGISEASAFSVDGTTLRQNTMGIGSGYAYYQIPDIVDLTQGYSIEVRARVISKESSFTGAFSFSATEDPSLWTGVLLDPNKVEVIADAQDDRHSITFDNTSFHDYELVVTPGGTTYSFFIDSSLMDSGFVNSRRSDFSNVLWFGDGTRGANGQAEITKFVFQQPAPIPVPGAFVLFASGLLALARLRKAA